MPKITCIDCGAARILKERMEEALKPIGEEFELDLKLGNYSWEKTGENATFKIEVATLGESGEVKSRTVLDFQDCAWRWGLEPTDLNRKFIFRDEYYELIGAKPRSYKFPLLAKLCRNEKVYKFHPDSVKGKLI